MWPRLVNYNAQKSLCPKSLLEVSYKIRATFTMYDKSERLLCPFSQGLKVIEVAHDMQLA